MYIPLLYQASEYDCVPTAFINAVAYLFERHEIPPMVIRHIYMYSLDTVGRDARLGIGGTSRHAVRLLGHWLMSYKLRKFSLTTEFMEEKEVNLRPGSRILSCLDEEGIALCKISLGGREEHYLMVIRVEDDWVYCFDPYFRTSIRGLHKHVLMLRNDDNRSPNIKIRVDWIEKEDPGLRFCFGPYYIRVCLLLWRDH